MARPFLLLVLGVGLSILVGCNSSNSDSDSDSDAGSKSDSASGGSGVEEPSDVNPQPNSPAGTVQRLWRQVEGGSPAMVFEYDPRIRRLVGSGGILTVLSPPPPQFSGRPQIVSVEETQLGNEVIVRSQPPGSKIRYTSLYLLVESGNRWLVRYDSNLNSAVGSYITRRTQDRIDPEAEQPARKATAAGDAAAGKLRALFAPGPKNGPLVGR